MLHPALWKLLRLQWRGGFRQFYRSLRTFRGLFQLGFMIVIFGYLAFVMIMAQMFSAVNQPVAQAFGGPLNDVLSLGLLVFTTYSLLFSTGDAIVHFSASEVAFLFPAPVSRRELLAYQLLKNSFGIAAVSLMFTFMAAGQFRMIVARFIAIFLTVAFMSLTTMNVAFLRQVAHARIHFLVRQILGIFVGVLILAAVGQAANTAATADFVGYTQALRNSTTGSLLLAPFQVFVRAIRAPDLVSFAWPALLVFMVDLGLMFLAFRLDALSLEAALTISEKMTTRLKLMQTRGVWQAFGTTTSKVARRKIPLPPFWAGVGPVLWQRMTTTLRSSSRILWLLGSGVIGVAALVYFVGRAPGQPEIAPVIGIGSMYYLSLLICLSMQHDIDRVGFLKSLPIRSTSIVLGDLIGLPLIISTVQSLFILVEAFCFPKLALWMIGASLLTLPLNLLMFSADKLVFYIYPTRLVKGAPGDFQAAGKQMIFMTLKMLMLGASAAIVAAFTAPVGILTESPAATIAVAGFIMTVECVAFVPLLTIAFNRFDASMAQAG